MDTKHLNLTEISAGMGKEIHYMTFPDGRTVSHVDWDQKDFFTVFDSLKADKELSGKRLFVTESPAPWITVGMIDGFKPQEMGYLYPDSKGCELEMTPLKRGAPAENHDVQFIVEEDGDRLFVNMTSDRPEARDIGHHTFDIANLPEVLVPDIPRGKDVFLHGWGMYCVMCRVALTFIPDSRSLFIACHDSDYICAYSADGGRRVGDTVKRTGSNPLPH